MHLTVTAISDIHLNWEREYIFQKEYTGSFDISIMFNNELITCLCSLLGMLKVQREQCFISAYHLLIQASYHLFQFLVSFLQVFLCSFQGIEFSLCTIHFFFHPPSQFITDCWNKGSTDGILTDSSISTGSCTRKSTSRKLSLFFRIHFSNNFQKLHVLQQYKTVK